MSKATKLVKLLGYDVNNKRHLKNAKILLETNSFFSIKCLDYILSTNDNLDSYISLCGTYPKLKIKNANINSLIELITTLEVDIHVC